MDNDNDGNPTVNGLSTGDVSFKFDGAQFGTVVENNQVIGGSGPIFGDAPIQNESSSLSIPSPWGWYDTPQYDVTVSGNTFSGLFSPIIFETNNGTAFPGFYLFQGTVTDNTFIDDSAPGTWPALEVGGSYVPGSPSSYSVTVSGNDVVLPAGQQTQVTITYTNSQGTSDQGYGSPGTIDLPAAPAGPAKFTATADTNTGQIDLAWSAVTNASGYAIERSPDVLSGWDQIAVAGANATSYSDTGLDDLTTYYYRIRALTANGDSEFTATVSATTGANLPSEFTATSLGQDGADYVGTGSQNAPNGYQDIDLLLSGLSGQTIDYVDVLGPNGFEWQYDWQNGPDPHSSDPAWLIQSSGATSAHLYIEPEENESGSTYEVTVYYVGGTQTPQAATTGVYATYQLADPTATSEGQDGADYVGSGDDDAPNGYQDIDILLGGLAPTKTVNYIDVLGTTNAGGEWQYNEQNGPSPHGSDPAAFVQTPGSTTAHLYVEPYQNETGRTYQITVYYSDGTSFEVSTNAVYATYHLAGPTATSLGQDGADYVGSGSDDAPNGYQDIDIVLSGLNPLKSVAYIDVLGYGGGEWQYDEQNGPNPHGSDPAAFVQATGSTTGHLYVEPYQDETGRTYEITVMYTDGTSFQIYTNGVYATYRLAD